MTETANKSPDTRCKCIKPTMKYLRRDQIFRVKAETIPGESVFVVGNCEELGNWMSSSAVRLSKDDDPESCLWSCCVKLPQNQDVEFRYFVGVYIEPEIANDGAKQIIVRRWETSIQPRNIRIDAEDVNIGEEEMGKPDIFGSVQSITSIERGWLTSETVIQLKLFNNPLQLWKKRYEGKKISLKVTPVNLARNRSSETVLPFSENIDESMDTHDQVDAPEVWPLTEIAVMNEEKRKFHLQEQFGHIYSEGEFVLFQICVLQLESMAYLVDFYLHNSTEEDPPTLIGFSYILPSVLRKSEGQAIVPVTSTNHRPIGQLTVEYLVVQPIENFSCSMEETFSRMWKPSWQGLDVGHRGLGTSFKLEVQLCSDIRENTIASLKTAALHGADLVEFDVQLSKDLVPVLYHDFHVCIAMKRKQNLDINDKLQLPVKELTLEQLQLLKAISSTSKILHFCEYEIDSSEESCGVYHLKESTTGISKFNNEDHEDHQPFPTLQKVLEVVDPHVGFNIEIKWTMQLQDGSYELYNPFDLNMYLDIMLKVVLQHAGHRKIVFSCFHPDVCTMIRLKQNKYPVMFLTQGVTKKYAPYHDPRTHSIPMAVHHAHNACILGINVHTEDVLRDSTQVKLALDSGLIVFCWGDDNNCSSTIKHLKNLGLHGIIYDKIDKFGTKEVKESIFLVEAREAQNNLLNVVQKMGSGHSSTGVPVDVGTTRQTLSTLSVSAHNTSAVISDGGGAFESTIKEIGKDSQYADCAP
ncbi:hypothetical protein R5R35_007014 [Gryllus longicercus]|uniref:Glycerophosphocholine phosphodiesterase GPCPD1 n=1 Tax=Gryllus longicercus TaxID=2509291 RepID=A0AAN9ZDS8_9ORTH